jgi:hypothetical protein
MQEPPDQKRQKPDPSTDKAAERLRQFEQQRGILPVDPFEPPLPEPIAPTPEEEQPPADRTSLSDHAAERLREFEQQRGFEPMEHDPPTSQQKPQERPPGKPRRRSKRKR